MQLHQAEHLGYKGRLHNPTCVASGRTRLLYYKTVSFNVCVGPVTAPATRICLVVQQQSAATTTHCNPETFSALSNNAAGNSVQCATLWQPAHLVTVCGCLFSHFVPRVIWHASCRSCKVQPPPITTHDQSANSRAERPGTLNPTCLPACAIIHQLRSNCLPQPINYCSSCCM